MNITLENMTQSSRAEKAMELHKSGFNCAQAVFLAFSDLYPFDSDTAARIAGPLGGGLGGQHEVCGAVSAMALVLGMRYGYSDPADKTAKVELYQRVQTCSAAFRDVTDSIICHELLGINKNGPQPKLGERPPQGKIPCRTLVGLCAAILEDHMSEVQ